MTLNIALRNISTYLGLDWGLIVLIVLVLGSLIFFAKDFKIGSILLLLCSTCSFMLSYANKANGWNFAPSVIVMFISIIFMALSFYAVGQTKEGII